MHKERHIKNMLIQGHTNLFKNNFPSNTVVYTMNRTCLQYNDEKNN